MTEEKKVLAPAPAKKPNAVPVKIVDQWREEILAEPQYRSVNIDFLNQLLDIYAYDNGKLYGDVLEKYNKDQKKRAKEEAKQAIRDKKAEGLKNLEAEKNLSPEGKQDVGASEPVQPSPVSAEGE